MSPTLDDVRARLEPWLTRHTRTGFVPQTEDGEGPPAGSRFGGRPWLPQGAERPKCPSCKQDWPLFLQLDLATLPGPFAERHGPGLLQFFYCTEEDCEQEDGWFPRAVGHGFFVRDASAPGAVASSSERDLPAKAIQGWSEVSETPHPGDHDGLGLHWSWDHEANTARLRCDDPALDLDGLDADIITPEALATAGEGDKLGGWPFWVQGPERASCSRCQTAMTVLFQIDSEVNVDWMFGDSGCGHISRCPSHPDEWVFGWACC